MEFRVGVVGSCPPTKFDEVAAQAAIVDAFNAIAADYSDYTITIVSGLTDVGVLALAYAEATKRGWRTVGFASKRATEHPLYPVNENHVVGETWGDESPAFIDYIKNGAIIRIGGGKQSHAEVAIMKSMGRPAYEYEIPIF